MGKGVQGFDAPEKTFRTSQIWENTTAFNPGVHIDESLANITASQPQGKNLETSLSAFQIIKEHGDRLWKDGMRFEAG